MSEWSYSITLLINLYWGQFLMVLFAAFAHLSVQFVVRNPRTKPGWDARTQEGTSRQGRAPGTSHREKAAQVKELGGKE